MESNETASVFGPLELERAFSSLIVALDESLGDPPALARALRPLGNSSRFAMNLDYATDQMRFDAVHAHDTFALWPAQRLSSRDSAPLVVDLVEVTRLSDRAGSAIASMPAAARNYLEYIDQKIIRKAAAAFTVSESLRDYLERRHAREVTVLRNARPYRELVKTSALRELCGAGPETKIVCYVNRIGIDMGILEVMDAIAQMGPQVILACIGQFTTSDTERLIREHAVALNIAERVHFLEELPSSAFLELISGADVGVNCVSASSINLQVSLPNRVFDYIAARVPFSTSEVGDAAPLVRKHAIGNVFTEINGYGIARALEEILADPARFATAMEQAASELSWQQEVKVYLEEMQRLTMNVDKHVKSVAIVARKNILYNTRIVQQAKSLSESGFQVAVFSISGFAPQIAEELRDIKQVKVPLEPGSASMVRNPAG